ncbi:lipocalin family protein [Ferrimonas pelagia]
MCWLPLLVACTGLPAGVEPVKGFELNRYLGAWHEVARLDHSFERGLSQVSATYSMRDDGGVRVINRGWDTQTGEWREAQGKAYFVGTPDTAHLKVSFFGPFYGSYAVFWLDDNYQYAFISGNTNGYLWLLARSESVPEAIKLQFIAQARALGFNPEQLIWL